MRKLLSVLIGLVLLTVISCNPNITCNEKTAEDFVKIMVY